MEQTQKDLGQQSAEQNAVINSALSNALTQMRQREVQIAEIIPEVNSMEGQSERDQAMTTIYANDIGG